MNSKPGIPADVLPNVLNRVNSKFFAVLIFSCGVAGCRADRALNTGPDVPVTTASSRQDFVVVPGLSNALQFRLYTNASPDAPHLVNTFDIEAYGEVLLQSPGGDPLKRWLASSSSNHSLHNILIDGAGPELASANGMKLIDGGGFMVVGANPKSTFAGMER